MHEGKQHGIDLDLIPKDTELLICADSGSNDYEQHKILKEKGINVLILDHHEAPKVSEYACVVNNQLCDYPNKNLSGVGIVYKLCKYIDKLRHTAYSDCMLDLVALGNIADVMSLKSPETKRLIEKGLANINNPYIREMCKKNSFSLGNEITPTGFAFYIAPYVNATIRVGSLQEKILVFESMLEFKGGEKVPSTKRGHHLGDTEILYEQACRVCGNVKNKQTKIRDHGLEIAENIIASNNLLDKKILIVQLPKATSCDRNLTGLIANVLMNKYQRPTLLLNETIDENGEVWWIGSGRGYSRCALHDFRGLLEDIGVENWGGYAQGHAQAFGVSVPDKCIAKLITRTEEYLEDFDFTPTYKVDRIYRDITPGDYQDLESICQLSHLWGQGVEEPKLAFENVIPSTIRLMSPDRNPTLKIILPNGLACIKFKSSQEEYDSLQTSEFSQPRLNIVGRCVKNEWNGTITPQIIIEDYEIVGV